MPRQYIKLFKEALQVVPQSYFLVPTSYKLKGIVRERVFRYELYHRLRSLQPAEDPLSLHAEIDKSGHHDFEEDDQKNPDFVFHIPGTHAYNTLVVEVKGTLERTENVINDFHVMTRFIEQYKYRGGLFILYNCTPEEFSIFAINNLPNRCLES